MPYLLSIDGILHYQSEAGDTYQPVHVNSLTLADGTQLPIDALADGQILRRDGLGLTGISIGSIKLNEFAAPDGSVDFSGQQAVSLRIENRTSDPVAPAVGQLWLRTDL